MIAQFLPKESDTVNEIQTPLLKIRGKTLILGNSIFQIPNIALLELVDLSTIKPTPPYFLWLGLIGLGLLFVADTGVRLFGLIILGVLAFLYYQHEQNKQRTRYGLSIRLNSSTRNTIVSGDKEFLKRVMIVLYNVMNSDELKAVNINLDQRHIDQSSISVEQMMNSNIVTGTVGGDVVSNV